LAGGGTSQPPSITQQPADQTATVGNTAQFSVTATGAGPLAYQWYKNGALMSGATGSTYSIPNVAQSDDGARVYVLVVDINSLSTASNAATLHVTSLATVATPSISPSGGSFSAPVQVALACATSSAQIYYTTDGSAPSQSSTLYNAPFTVSAIGSTMVMAEAILGEHPVMIGRDANEPVHAPTMRRGHRGRHRRR